MTETPKDKTPGMDSNGPSPSNPQQPKSTRRVVLDNVISLGLALLIVFMVRSSVVEAFKIPSGSMIPTLLIGDHIFVNKFAYGFKIPFSDLNLSLPFLERPILTEPVYLIHRDPPKRGDVIVFRFPKEEQQTVYYIKRVVGVPGDTIEVREKVLYVNNKPVGREPAPAEQASKVFNELDDPKYSSTNLDLFNEKLDSTEHPIMQDKNPFLNETFPPTSVPPDSLFVMGDNRDFSNDSRFWGFVPMKNVKGKAMIIWLSLWVSFSDSQFVFRPGRMLTILR